MYNIHDVVETKLGNIIITDTSKTINGKRFRNGYEYRCLTCGNIGNISESNLKLKHGCPVCANIKVLVGHNDMWTTNPELASLLVNPEDGYLYTQRSSKRTNWKCQECGNIIKDKKISNVNIYGLSCPRCSDGISFPEKIMHSVLSQLEVKFITQLSSKNFSWCGKYRYDFYIPNFDIIIETHGIQHYRYTGWNSVESVKLNDYDKMCVAIKNKIEKQNYIVIDCMFSNIEYIKENILKSKLSDIFDLNKINWDTCLKYSQTSLIKEVCNLYIKEKKNMSEISNITNLSISTVCRYLKSNI